MFTLSSASCVAALVVLTTTVQAQDTAAARRWEVRLPTGGLIATGAQRDQLKDANLLGIQVSRAIGSRFAVTGTFAWARSRDLTATDRPKLDVFASDLGVEARSGVYFADAPVSVRTFAGVGAGARSYNYRNLDVDATNNVAAYGAVGGELGLGRVALRVEARDYATGFKPLIGGGKSDTRNDVVILAAFRFNRRAAEAR